MIEDVLNRRNLHKAYLHVLKNQGSAGVDGMPVKALAEHLRKQGATITEQVRSNKYTAQSILGKKIPKRNGKTRLLGIPTVSERWLQQSVLQAITLKFEQSFSEHSYGFRLKKNGHQCVLQSQEYIHKGYSHIVEIDLANFFDEVNHCLLLQLVYNKIKCPIIMRLIRKWLRSPLQINGRLHKRRKGLPQGSPLSPLLSNIMLNELDKYMEKEGIRYVRYADDFSLYAKSKSEARKIGNKVYLYLKDKLKLPINRAKSGLRRPSHFRILGYGYVPVYTKGSKGRYQFVVSENNWQELKAKLKYITRKTRPISVSERIQQLNEVQRGWVNYFRMANIHGKLKEVDSWVRNRLRYCIWHDWKKPERRRKNLQRLGVDPEHAYAYSRSRLGGWRISQSPILTTTITLKRLQQKGYKSMLEHYFEVSPQFNEPLYTRPVRTVV